TILAILFFYKEFQLLIFNKDFARAIGLPVRRLEFLFNSLMVLAVVTGIQAIGVVLMAALLITPAAAAKFWTNRLSKMLIIAVLIALFSGISGAYISFILPNMPTGPWVVVVLSALAFFSFFFSPTKGLVTRWYSKRTYQRKIHEDHILKVLYHASENQLAGLPTHVIRQNFPQKETLTKSSINTLINKGYIHLNEDVVCLTSSGSIEARRIIRLHRLWELYLTEHVNIAPDHVHDTAGKIEHILTPEIEAKLEAKLNYPDKDPHQSIIPRDQ